MNTTEPNIQAQDPFTSPYFEENTKPRNNVLMGTLGAFLFSFIGAALWFGLYQIGGSYYGFAGFIMVIVTIKGYQLFSKKINWQGRIISVAISIVMGIVAETACLGFEIFKAYKLDYTITIFDAFGAIPDFLSDPKVSSAVIQDLEASFLFAFIAIIAGIIRNVMYKYSLDFYHSTHAKIHKLK